MICGDSRGYSMPISRRQTRTWIPYWMGKSARVDGNRGDGVPMGTMCACYAIFSVALDSILGGADFELWSHAVIGMGI